MYGQAWCRERTTVQREPYVATVSPFMGNRPVAPGTHQGTGVLNNSTPPYPLTTLSQGVDDGIALTWRELQVVWQDPTPHRGIFQQCSAPGASRYAAVLVGGRLILERPRHRLEAILPAVAPSRRRTSNRSCSRTRAAAVLARNRRTVPPVDGQSGGAGTLLTRAQKRSALDADVGLRPTAARPFMELPLARLLTVLGLLFIFLLGVNGLGDAFKSLGGGLLDSFFAATENPFMGLMVGILATTLVQSSSVSTALIVGLVAAPENALPIANAVPMIMGANIGTTVTNTLVSLAHMGRREEFNRAFAVATCHDFFNFMAVALLLPLEMATGYLQKTATWLSSLVTDFGGVSYDSPIKGALKTALKPIKAGVHAVSDSERVQAILLILVSGLLIYLALLFLVRVMRGAMNSRVETILSRGAMNSRVETILSRGLFHSPIVAIVVGISVTVMVQSSSITTSLLVPLAGAGILTLEQAFPVTIGANIGTTVTAFLAALAVTGPNAIAGLTIALVHLLFNLTATILIYPVKRVRDIPLNAARRLAKLAVRSKPLAFLYVIVLFYGLPALFAFLNRAL